MDTIVVGTSIEVTLVISLGIEVTLVLSWGVEVTKLLKNIVMLSSFGCGCVLGRGGALPGL